MQPATPTQRHAPIYLLLHQLLRRLYWSTPFSHWRHRDPQLRTICSLLQPGMTAIDVGADVALYTIAFAQRVGDAGQVLSFEPHPTSSLILQTSLSVRKLPWVSLSCSALGACRGSALLATPVGPSGWAKPPLSHIVQAGTVCDTSLRAQPTEVHRLDDFLPLISRVDLIKIDVEGYEYEVLRGGEQMLRTHRPRLFIEIEQRHHDRLQRNAEVVFSLLSSLGYVRATAIEENFTPGNFLFEPRDA